MDNKKKQKLIHIVTPFIVILFCSAIVAVGLIKPYDKLKMYMNLAFMDDLKTTPENKSSGLVIKNNDIDENYNGTTTAEGEIKRPEFGELYAMLNCNAFGTSVPVYWGTNTELLDIGACQATGSVVVGDKGNTVISAHVDTFFADMEKLAVGDKISLVTVYGEFAYTVKEKILFASSDGRYVSPTEDDRLTLYTCKRDILGNTDQRTGVICELTERKFYSNAEVKGNE